MTPERFEQLLYESESETLDFKEGQYAFSGATDEQKSELLKDILGFTNAWRRTEAYILIGVRTEVGGKAVVVGCDEHLPDHSLQQFVNTKTNRPVQFSYETVQVEGKQVGVITIRQQERPVALTVDYGKLKKDKVYVRRSSSTDPTRPASLDETLKMQQASITRLPALDVQFHDPKSNSPSGSSVQIAAQFIKFPSREDLPTLRQPARATGPFGIVNPGAFLYTPNPEYYRELAIACHHQHNLKPIQLTIVNRGECSAEDVRLELEVPLAGGIEMLEEHERITEWPRRQHGFTPVIPTFSGFRSAARADGTIDLDRDGLAVRVAVEFSNIQPERSVLTEKFYVACTQSGTVTLTGKVFSKNLPKAVDVELSMEFDVSLQEVETERFLESADNPQQTEEE